LHSRPPVWSDKTVYEKLYRQPPIFNYFAMSYTDENQYGSLKLRRSCLMPLNLTLGRYPVYLEPFFSKSTPA